MANFRWAGASVIAVAMVLSLGSCTNPRTDLPTGNTGNNDSAGCSSPETRPSVSLRPSNKVGDQFRTTRTLRVEESTESERYLTESEEVTLTKVLRVDDSGRLLSVQRAWESSLTRLTHGFGKGEEARGELDGCTLELSQRASSVDVKLLVGTASVRGANFLIEGFDTGLLPLDPVRENDFWVLEGSRLSGLNRIIEAMQYVIEKNKLTCQLFELTPASARVSLNWRISGELQGAMSVLEFTGELVFDRKHKLISHFELKGGRQSERRAGQQIEISITRRAVSGWLDLDG